ncbi:DUF2061 domain-containing protein [Mesorhizobium sp. M0514]|uniref:DUF2061 domain-containing protein n=1 Tax=Mesorhizobium sp. M0514 TaxID=2956955 RepID=UPI00333BF536
MDTHSRSFAKALSWRATGTIDTMIISLVITGSIKLAAAIGATEVVTKSLLYYVHERAWLKIPYGRKNTAYAQRLPGRNEPSQEKLKRRRQFLHCRQAPSMI